MLGGFCFGGFFFPNSNSKIILFNTPTFKDEVGNWK